ncbi:MAG: serine hydrolase [Chthonomonadaceae bacterium]|nr:serine hydrolase [Chthonomonadaceae bacterium]
MFASLAAALMTLSLPIHQSPRVPLEGHPIFGDLGKQWEALMPDFHVTGYSVVAIQEGKVVLLDGIGSADPTRGTKADLDTRYYIASITKTMTATAILQLAEQGKLELDAPVQRYLPRFTLADAEYAKTITLRDLLCHRPGIGGGRVWLLEAYTGQVNDDRFYKILGTSQPEKKVTYSNAHFTILGRVIEAVTGMGWREYLAKNVFAPLGMTRTTGFISAMHDDANKAVPLRFGRGGVQIAEMMKTDRTMHAAGGIVTTPRDMVAYLQMWMNQGAWSGTRVLPEKTVGDALTIQAPIEENGSIRILRGFGYAWNLGAYRKHEGFAAHGGSYTGYGAYIAMLPKEKTAVAVFVNTGQSGGAFGTLVAIDMLDRMLGYPVDKELRADYLAQALKFSDGIVAGKTFGPNPALSGQLSLPAESYAGVFANEPYGSIEVSLTGGQLKLDWGDLSQLLVSSGMDMATLHDSVDARASDTIRFVVEGKRVTGLVLDPEGDSIRFERKR